MNQGESVVSAHTLQFLRTHDEAVWKEQGETLLERFKLLVTDVGDSRNGRSYVTPETDMKDYVEREIGSLAKTMQINRDSQQRIPVSYLLSPLTKEQVEEVMDSNENVSNKRYF